MSSPKNQQDVELQAKDLLRSKYLKLQQSTNFENAVMHLGQSEANEAVIVGDEDHFVGVFRSKDVAKAMVEKHGKTEPIGSFLTLDNVQVEESTPLDRCLQVLVENKLSTLPVVRGDRVCGVLNLNEVMESLQSQASDQKVASSGLKQEINVRDDYLGVLSHDLRTPLSVIILCADYLLADKNRKLLTPDHISFIERIQKNAHGANDMVKDILEVVRKESDISLNYSDVLIEDFLTNSISNLQLIANQKNIKLELSCEQPIKVAIDSNRMVHVLENLVNNAVKFSPNDKVVKVSAEVENRKNQNYLVLSVKDEGPGIKPEDEKLIFDKFRQSDNDLASTADGVGLGLAIVRKFVELHQGFVEVEGGWKTGATFKAYIPGGQYVEGVTTAEPEVASGERKTSVLLVEDDESIREYFSEELKMEGFDVHPAVNGEDGYNQYLRFKPDIVLSDIKMPVMDGLELLAKIRNNSQDIPVVLCSGYYPGLAEDLATSSFKANHVIEKPVGIDYVIKVFERCLGEERIPKAS